MKNIFYKQAKTKSFITGDLVLKLDARTKSKGKHGNLDIL
jgi:hypothetical protein